MTNTQDTGYAAEKAASDAHLDQLIMSHRAVATFLPDEADQLSAFAYSIVSNQVTGAQLVSTLWTALTRLANQAPAKVMANIPPDVACPHCGGYVRGHQYIGTKACSVSEVNPAL